LASLRVLHRDLAARNVLMTAHKCLKIADFGRSQQALHSFYSEGYSAQPLRWMAPESLTYCVYSEKSDV